MAHPALAAFIDHRRVSGELLERLERLTESDVEIILPLIDDLHPSANTLRVWLRLADDIAARDGRALTQIFSATEVQAICRAETSRKERQKILRVFLERQRFPLTAKIRDELDAACAELLREFGLELLIPRDLEGDLLEVKIGARSAPELEAAALRLQRLAQHPATAQVFRKLRGEDG